MSRARTSDADLAAALQLWATGIPIRVMAEQMGCSRGKVAGIIASYRDQFPLRQAATGPEAAAFWTEERLAEAVKLWNAGLSIAKIGVHFGVTKNQSWGLVERNRDLFPKRPPREKAERKAKPPRAPKPAKAAKPKLTIVPKPAPAPKPVVVADPVVEIAKEDAFRPLPGTEPLTVLSALERNRCRWPVHAEGEDPIATKVTLFCGCQRLYGSPYCATHREMSCGAGTPSERQAIGDAVRAERFSAGRAA